MEPSALERSSRSSPDRASARDYRSDEVRISRVARFFDPASSRAGHASRSLPVATAFLAASSAGFEGMFASIGGVAIAARARPTARARPPAPARLETRHRPRRRHRFETRSPPERARPASRSPPPPRWSSPSPRETTRSRSCPSPGAETRAPRTIPACVARMARRSPTAKSSTNPREPPSREPSSPQPPPPPNARAPHPGPQRPNPSSSRFAHLRTKPRPRRVRP